MQEHLHQPTKTEETNSDKRVTRSTNYVPNKFNNTGKLSSVQWKTSISKKLNYIFFDRSVCDLNQYIIQIAVASCDFLDSTREVGIVKENWPWHNRWEGDQLVAVAPGGGESREVAATAALQGCPNRRIHRQSTHTAPEDSSLGTHASMQTLSALALLWDSRGATHGFIRFESSYALSPTTKQIQNIHTMRLRLNICAGFTSISTYYMTIRTW